MRRPVDSFERGKSSTVFLPAALPDGDIDYRFPVEAMHDAGYEGYTVIEGAPGSGNQFPADQTSLDYMKGIWTELEGTTRTSPA